MDLFLSRISRSPWHLVAIILPALIATGCGGGDSTESSSPSGTATYSVGGAISGLAGSGLALLNNAGDILPISGNGPFTFAGTIASTGPFSVTVSVQPANPSQTCSVSNGSGSIGGSDVTNVAVSCVTNTFKVGGSVSGLHGSGLTLRDRNGDDLAVASNATSFTFATAVASGASYAVTVLTQPGSPVQNCTISNGGGVVGASDVTNVQLACADGSASSSADLIDAALRAGTINLETAIEYKMFATFKDGRLPASFQGNDSDVVETDAFDLTWENWGTLSDAARQTLVPFLVPPIYKGSWASIRSAGGRAAAASVRPGTQGFDIAPCQQPEVDANWAAKLGPRVKVWYDTRIANADAQASLARDELENNIWPAIVTRVGMKAPLSDAGVRGCNGGDGLLDVYLVDMAGAGQASTDLGDTLPAQGFSLKQSPVFILLNRSLTNDVLKGSLAHEFTHASQWAYPVAATFLNSYHWLKESTAQEAIDIVYPTLPYSTCKYPGVSQLEQCKAVPFMSSPQTSLDDASDENRLYGSYLFFQFLVKTNAPAVLADVWNSTTSQSDQVKAVDAAISGGFETQWPLFAKLLWNQPPVDVNSFSAWDQLTVTPTPFTSAGSTSSGPLSLSLGGQPTASVRMEGNIPHLATHYYWFKVTDQNVRSLLFDNHLFAIDPNPGSQASSQAFYLTEGSTWQYANWSRHGVSDATKFFCLDVTSERIQELVIAMSNDSFAHDITSLTADQQPRVAISDAGCWQYAGTVSAERNGTDASGATFRVTLDAAVTFQRSTFPLPLLNGANGPIGFQVSSGTLTATEEDTDGMGGSLVETASGPTPADSLPGQPTLAVAPGFDRIGLGSSPQTVTAASESTTLPTHIVTTYSDGTKLIRDNPTDWTWLVFPPSDFTPTELLQSNAVIAGSYTDTFGTKYTWRLSPKRQP